MTVEELMRLLSEYPPHWRVEVGSEQPGGALDRFGRVVEVSARQECGPGQRHAHTTPVVVIAS